MYWTTAPEDAINLKAIVGSHSQSRWTTVELLHEEIFVVIFVPCISHINLCIICDSVDFVSVFHCIVLFTTRDKITQPV